MDSGSAVDNRSIARDRVRTWAVACAALDDGDAFVYRSVVENYLDYWMVNESCGVDAAGSVERYVLGWCEDPGEFVIELLVRLADSF
jgi:hypothetical protein